MKPVIVLALAALAAPAAFADVTYSRVVVLDEPVAIHAVPRVCENRNNELWDRKALLDQDKRDVDAEGAALARAKSRLDGELAQLDRTNTAAVADYNARSNALNDRVNAYNARVADLNHAVALLNGDSREMVDWCNRMYYARR
jgi:cell division protein FtsB